jgi:hypothetical protein
MNEDPAERTEVVRAFFADAVVSADRHADVALIARCTIPGAEKAINQVWFDLIGSRFQKALAIPDVAASDWIAQAAPALSPAVSEDSKAAAIAGLIARLPMAFDVVIDGYGEQSIVALATLLKNFASQVAVDASRHADVTPCITTGTKTPLHDTRLGAAIRSAAAQALSPPLGARVRLEWLNPVPANIALQVSNLAAVAVARHASGLAPDNAIYRQVAIKCTGMTPAHNRTPRRRQRH